MAVEGQAPLDPHLAALLIAARDLPGLETLPLAEARARRCSAPGPMCCAADRHTHPDH